ncbi:hypothetical protein LCGC14_3002510 [marine sediment metagenome]|uniref:Uncharacterized protein n=1 Tax=marine sediment metagenome TaxID=412755 RepID=A0A0F8X127_9ZZZZ
MAPRDRSCGSDESIPAESARHRPPAFDQLEPRVMLSTTWSGDIPDATVWATGEVHVAWKPPSVVCVDGEEETLKVLKRKKLDQFIRVKESVNKNAIRDAKLDPKRLESFKIEIQTSQRVDIKPVSVKLAEAKPPRSAA